MNPHARTLDPAPDGEPGSNPHRHRFESVAAVALVAVALAVLVRLGQGPLAGPRGWTRADLSTWVRSHDAATLGLATVRLGAMALVVQLATASGLAAAGSALRVPGLLRAADLLSLPGTQHLVRRVAGITLSVASLAPAPPALPHHAHLATLTVDPGNQPGRAVTDTATLAVLSTDASHEVTLTRATDHDREPGTATLTPSPTARTWLVDTGDHLWSIAQATLRSSWNRDPAEREVDGYWRDVVRANRQLSDPDLLYAGEVVALPPVPADRASG